MKYSTEELYRIKPSALENMPYRKALELKIEKAKEHVDALYNIHFKKRNDELFTAVYKSISFNKQLLEELET